MVLGAGRMKKLASTREDIDVRKIVKDLTVIIAPTIASPAALTFPAPSAPRRMALWKVRMAKNSLRIC